jgi:hypothetical protein
MRLEFIQAQAEARSLTAVQEGVQGYRDGMKVMSRALPDVFSEILTQTNDKLLTISGMAIGTIVNVTGQSGFATNSGEINAVVYTKANNLNRPSFIVFDDVFSD